MLSREELELIGDVAGKLDLEAYHQLEQSGMLEHGPEARAVWIEDMNEAIKVREIVRRELEAEGMTNEQRDSYLKLANQHGWNRQQRHGDADAIAFAMGASVVFEWMGNFGQVPSMWVFGPLAGKPPFYDPAEDVAELNEWATSAFSPMSYGGYRLD